MSTTTKSFLAVAAFTAGLAAQGPLLTMTPAVSLVSPNPSVQWSLAGPIPTAHAILADTRGGPAELYGATFLLGLSPSLATLHFAMSSASTSTGSFGVPPNPGLIGLTLFAQSVVLTATAANGLFLLGNGASSIVHAAPAAVVLDFTSPWASGFQGNFRDDIAGHIRGGPVQRRSKDTFTTAAALFGAPVLAPLAPAGCREQMVFRALDLGATGEPELVTGVNWLLAGQAQADSFLQFELRMGHTPVIPDYSVSPFSGLPQAPGSGLSSLFAANEMPGAPPVTVFLGRYDINPAAVMPHLLGQLMPYPAITPFAYDGASSLLLDFRVGQGVSGSNGMRVQLMVTSSPLPAARAVAGGTILNPQPIPNPGQVTQAHLVDCAMPVLQFEFARVETHAESPWQDSGRSSPDYRVPLLAASLALGTSVELRFRGSHASNGTGASIWSTNQDIADGMRYLQIDVRLRGNPMTDAVPIVDTLVVPVH